MYYIIDKFKFRDNALNKLFVYVRPTPQRVFFDIVFNELTTDNIFIFRNRLAYYLDSDRIDLSIRDFRRFLKRINKV